MEILKTHKLKTVKQLIELDLQGKIKLDIYESLYYAYICNSIKIFDLLIKTYYKSIDFNKQIDSKHTLLYYMIFIKSKCLNFILINVKIDNLHISSIFHDLCRYSTLKSVKLFISIIKSSVIKELIIKKIYEYSPLENACFNKLNIVKYLLNFIIFDSNLININIFCRSEKENIIKYLLENFKFNLNKQNEYGYTIMQYIHNLNIAKMLFKYDGNIDLEIKNQYNYKSIDYIYDIKIYKFLVKYTKAYNIIFENPEIFKFINKN